jgi:hypothetical protein
MSAVSPASFLVSLRRFLVNPTALVVSPSGLLVSLRPPLASPSTLVVSPGAFLVIPRPSLVSPILVFVSSRGLLGFRVPVSCLPPGSTQRVQTAGSVVAMEILPCHGSQPGRAFGESLSRDRPASEARNSGVEPPQRLRRFLQADGPGRRRASLRAAVSPGPGRAGSPRKGGSGCRRAPGSPGRGRGGAGTLRDSPPQRRPRRSAGRRWAVCFTSMAQKPSRP